MQFDMDRFRATFFEEAYDHLASMEAALLEWEHHAGDPELINTVFRAAHSIKGASSTFGLDAIASFTHSLENLLDRVRQGELPLDSPRVDLCLRSADVLRGLVGAARDGVPAPAGVDDLAAEIRAMLGGRGEAAATSPGSPAAAKQLHLEEYEVLFRPGPETLRSGMEPLLLLRELAELGDVVEAAVDISALPPLVQIDPECCYLAWRMQIRTDRGIDAIREVFLFVEDTSEIEIRPVGRAPSENAANSGSPAAVPVGLPLAKAEALVDLASDILSGFAAFQDSAALSPSA